MKPRLFLIGAVLALVIPTPAFSNNLCTALLPGNSIRTDNGVRSKLKIDSTDGLIAYLNALLEHQIIGDSELLRLIDGLQNGDISNPILEEQTWISSAAMIHREMIQEYIEGPTLDRKRLMEWSIKSLKEKERVREHREVARKETQNIHQKMEFHLISPGQFQVGDDQHRVNPFEIMSTPVTQEQWVELMGENPSRFVDGDQTMVATVHGKAIKMQPDNPVEQVTWWSVVEYANRLSVKSGLRPVYDLSGVKFKLGTSAEAGTLASESGEVKINSPNGDIYKADGYRLPTEAEFYYILRAAGETTRFNNFGASGADFKDFGWYNANANGKTHPVAQLKPLSIDGYDFYDLLGNVSEWNNDWFTLHNNGGDDPRGAVTGFNRLLMGGSWASTELSLSSGNRWLESPSGPPINKFGLDRLITQVPPSAIGFRLGKSANFVEPNTK